MSKGLAYAPALQLSALLFFHRQPSDPSFGFLPYPRRWGEARSQNDSTTQDAKQALLDRLVLFEQANITVVAGGGPGFDYASELLGCVPGQAVHGGVESGLIASGVKVGHLSGVPWECQRLVAGMWAQSEPNCPGSADARPALPVPPCAAAACDNIIAAHPTVLGVGASDTHDQATAFGPFNSKCINIYAPSGGVGVGIVGASPAGAHTTCLTSSARVAGAGGPGSAAFPSY